MCPQNSTHKGHGMWQSLFLTRKLNFIYSSFFDARDSNSKLLTHYMMSLTSWATSWDDSQIDVICDVAHIVCSYGPSYLWSTLLHIVCFSYAYLFLAILKSYNTDLLDVDCEFKITEPCGEILDDANWRSLTKLNVPFWKGQEITQVVFGNIACPKFFD